MTIAFLPLLLLIVATLLPPIHCLTIESVASAVLAVDGNDSTIPLSMPSSSHFPSFPSTRHLILSLERIKVQVVQGETNAGCASAAYNDLVNSTGWGELTVRANASCSPFEAGYAMGFLEGFLTWERIWQAFQNFNQSNGWLQAGQLPPRLAQYVEEQTDWMRAKVAGSDEPYWQHVGALVMQADGMAAGYAQAAPASMFLSPTQVYILTMAGDLEDLARAYAEVPVRSGMHMDCSALVKLDETFADLYVGHTTFNAYWYVDRRCGA